MSEFNIFISNQYTNITDHDVDAIIIVIKQQTFPTCSSKHLQDYLLSQGYRVEQQRIRDAQRRIDPEGSVMGDREQLTIVNIVWQYHNPFGIWMGITS